MGACSCWEDKEIASASKTIKACDLSTKAKAFAKSLKKCTNAFGKCRKYEDAVSSALHNCNLETSVLKKKLKNQESQKRIEKHLKENQRKESRRNQRRIRKQEVEKHPTKQVRKVLRTRKTPRILIEREKRKEERVRVKEKERKASQIKRVAKKER